MKDEAKATILASLISGAVAVGVAWVTTGKKFEAELEATKGEVAAVKQDVAATKNELEPFKRDTATVKTDLHNAIASIAALQAKIDALTRATKAPRERVSVPVVAYAVTQPIPLEYGKWIPINYDRRVTDGADAVNVGSKWTLKVPANGSYLLSASVLTDVPANTQIKVLTPSADLLITPRIDNNPTKRVDASGLFRLRKGDMLSVEAKHSMHPTNVIGGEFSFDFVR